MKVAIAQLNPVVGDFDGNLAKLRSVLEKTQATAPDLVVLPELFLCGYPPRDLLTRRWFVERGEQALTAAVELTGHYPATAVLFGAVATSRQACGRGLYNVAVMAFQGRELLRQPKSLLPTYDVFDEARYFDPASESRIVEFRGERIGVTICEDAWNPADTDKKQPYCRDPVTELATAGATLLVNLAASPFTVGKEDMRYRLFASHARRWGVPFVFVNQIGGNDDLVFDGFSMAFDRTGRCQHVSPAFEEDITVVDTESVGRIGEPVQQDRIALVHNALVLGVRDYVRKCGFRNVVIGLSGGIDSAVTACIAVAALGSDAVLGVTMPSEFSSAGSVEDSRCLAQRLGIRFLTIPIQQVVAAYRQALEPEFAGLAPDTTEENIQARVRGNILMALANKAGRMVLSTGNKSELAVGYCTLYGDMSGGLAVIGDVPKTMVYQLASYINRHREVIPAATISKPPSAELKPNQRDQDTLPPYDVLDEIISRYVDQGQSVAEIVAAGFEQDTVDWVVRAIARSEFKRKQAAPSIKVTDRAFGTGWRMPIAARY